MFTTLLTNTVALLFLAVPALAQSGSVVSVDNDKKRIEVKVGDKTYEVAASSVELLDKEGKEAELADFAKGDKVTVTTKGEKVTKIQLAGDGALLLAPADEGTVISVDSDKKQIEIKVGDKTYTLAAADVSLLDKEGKKAELADFSKDDSILVTFDGGEVTAIQKQD